MQLAAGKLDYLPLSEVGTATLRLRFIGPFEGAEVVWEGTFTSLAACRQADPEGSLRSFIEVHESASGEMTLGVGLPVERFDHREIGMTIRMIRQYKRLARGRHEFGEPFYD